MTADIDKVGSGDAEQERIARVYAGRQKRLPPGYYSIFHPGNLYIVQRRERATLRLLADHGLSDLSDRRILEVGCGSGSELLRLVGWGADPGLMAGVDVLPERIGAARAKLPAADLREADARSLPFPDESFDLVQQFTLFSSVLDAEFRRRIAAEMLRILKPGGFILWYDMRYVRPGGALAGIGKDELMSLFPGCRYDIRAETLVPVVARRLARVSWLLCDIVAMLPFVRSHYVACIRKPLA